MSEKDSTPAVDFYRHQLGEAEVASLEATIASLFLTTGPRTRALEEALAERLTASHVVGVSSCTSGLFLALKALGIGPGDEVITTPLTFIATSNAILHAGATPVFADVLASTGNIDPEQVERCITPHSKAILPVHLYGQMADMLSLRSLAASKGMRIVEDAAHALEGKRDGGSPSHHGDAAVFSFYATKNLTCGDGGAVATNDADTAEKLRSLRNHGMSRDAFGRYHGAYQHWDMTDLGFKANLPDVLSALLLPQLSQIDAKLKSRAALATAYDSALSSLENAGLLGRPARVAGSTHAHHLYTIWVDPGQRDVVLAALKAAGIGVAVNYRAVHLLTYYRERFGYAPGAFPVAEDIGERTLSLPFYPGMPLEHVARVADSLEKGAAGMTHQEPRANAAASPLISVVIPVYNEEDTLEELHRRLKEALTGMAVRHELVFVDDGSRDASASIIRDLSLSDDAVRGIRFSRNFGQHIAITAGLDQVTGTHVVIMDADLQDQPECIPALYEKLGEGYDVVYGVRIGKKHSLFKRITSWLFLKTMRAITSENAEITTNIFRVMTREVADAVARCREQARFVVGLFGWVGFRQTSVEVPHGGRFAGGTKYTLLKMIRLAMNGITAFSRLPLQIASFLGSGISIWAFGWGGWLIARKLLWNTAVPGWTSTMVVLLLLGGVQLLSLGLIGSYIGRIYGEVQGRPLYIVAERFGPK